MRNDRDDEPQHRWNPGVKSDSDRQDYSRSEFGIGSEYGPDYSFRDFGQAEHIRDRWERDLPRIREWHDRNDWDDRDQRGEGRNFGTRLTASVPRGSYTGIGPKGYHRSDDRIHEDVCELLTQHGHIDASDIAVKVENGEVRLTGSVRSRQMKRLAEDVADQVTGVRDVHNELQITGSERMTDRAA